MGGVRRHPETYYTAFESLRNLHVESGQSVMVRGATSGVGVAFARRVRAGFPGVHLAGSTRSAGHAELLHRAWFNDMVFDVDGRLELEGHPFDRVLELIVLATLKDSCGHVREGGVGCITGLLGDQWCIEGLDPIMDLPANGYLTSFYSGNVGWGAPGRALLLRGGEGCGRHAGAHLLAGGDGRGPQIPRRPAWLRQGCRHEP